MIRGKGRFWAGSERKNFTAEERGDSTEEAEVMEEGSDESEASWGWGCYERIKRIVTYFSFGWNIQNKKHLKNVGPIRYCEPPHAHSPDVASGTVARRLRIDVHDNDDNDKDNAWQMGPLWPHGMGPTMMMSCIQPTGLHVDVARLHRAVAVALFPVFSIDLLNTA